MKKENENLQKEKGRLVWILLFFLFALGSIGAIIGFNKSFSISMFGTFVRNANGWWILLAILSILIYVLAEGWSLVCVCKSFGFKTKKSDGLFYSAADIYFSAITPSASGGQPASAYFMVKDGIDISITTLSLLFTLLMFSISILVIALISFIIKPQIFFSMGWMAKIFVLGGFFVQFFLVISFYFLIYKEKLMKRLCYFGLHILVRLRIIKDKEEKMKRLDVMINEYQMAAKKIALKKNVLLKVFLFNLLQRFCQIGVILFIYLATGGNASKLLDIWVIQSLTVMGAYSLPIPGAMGVTDYLLLEGFGKIMSRDAAVNLELLSRGLSFYFCILGCGILVLVRYMKIKRSK